MAHRMELPHIRRVIDQGVHGLIDKGETQLRHFLVQGIEWVNERGELYLSSSMAVQFFTQRQKGKPVRLGKCEHEVLRLLTNGHTPQQIALQLGYDNAEPVYAACKRVRNKLDAKTNAEAIHLALQRGLIWPADE